MESIIAECAARLNVEQKVRLLTGADFWSLHPEPAVGLRSLVVSDGPAGVRGVTWDERSPSANVPSPTALAATWDPPRIQRLGGLLASECRRKNVDVLLAPTVNIQRSPYGGRHFEMFSEDPLLTSVVGAAFVVGLQLQGIGATVKHFVANDSETDRYHANMVVDERTLREVYLAPFEVIVREARVWAVMAAYNQTNGVTMTESRLLRGVLHLEWGFEGVTMTDWFAGRSTEASADAALDLMMPGPDGPWGAKLVEAVRQGRVREDLIHDKVIRILRLAGRVGALSDGHRVADPAPWSDPDVAAELRSCAAAGFVLLRNGSPSEPGTGRVTPVLPIDRNAVRRVAVLGPNAYPGRTLGGGSALVFPPYIVAPLAGLTAALGPDVTVDYAPGVRAHTRLSPGDVTTLMLPSRDERGVEVQFLGPEGQVLGSEHRLSTTFNWYGVFGRFETSPVTTFRLHTRLTAECSGRHYIGCSGLGRFALSVDGVDRFDVVLQLPDGADPAEGLMRPPQYAVDLELSAGHVVDVVLVHEPDSSSASFDASMVAFQLNIEPPEVHDDIGIQQASELAAGADVAIVVVGTNEEVESEGYDRHSLQLPGRQDELVRRVAAVNERTVVVVNAGAPVLLPWKDEVAAILLTWFPGQEFGNALADVLLGSVEPGGRLPTTWPADEEAPLPSTSPVDGDVAYTEGLHLGYRGYVRSHVEPAYWFGHGLGYTTWSYGDPIVSSDGTGGATVVIPVRNTGTRKGRAVLQVYAARPVSAVERPARWLVGFVTVDAAPDEQVPASVAIRSRAFEHWDVESQQWVLEPGAFELYVARSAADSITCNWFTPVAKAEQG